ncbi:Rrf2 family transcriptional regulator [Aquisalimonas sp.]|uniref:RrF2 family transcriptional regulator n=1 Tax=Aquisalimonas sp. TaxID=1872621 RepID=UPI0025BCEA42|nr:Rrf2 family transcriptional regulator [Aquisalimonas sp.]
MELTQHTDYGLRVLMYAASNPDRLVTMREIARVYGISVEHLRKVVHRLARQGYLNTVKGRAGGMQLGRPAETIRVGDVVELLEESMAIVDCERQPCPLRGACALKRSLENARHAFLAELNKVTLADLAADQQTSRRLLKLALAS